MAVIERGSFTLDLGVFKIQTDISDADRQSAWELYTEIVTRVAVSGKAHDARCTDFDGEVFVESLDSLYAFFKEARGIMRKFPVGRLKRDRNHHLGTLINDLIVHALRPFLERWQADYRHWWTTTADTQKTPFERQKSYPRYTELCQDWTDLRLLLRALRDVLVKEYELVDIAHAPRLLGV